MDSIKNRLKRMLKGTLGLMVIFLLPGTGYVHAQTLPVYEKPYTIGNVLSDYQYFVQGDLNATNSGHAVGAVAVGGTLDTPNTVGDGQVAASYVKSVQNLGNFTQGQWITGTNTQYKVTAFYYDTVSATMPSWLKERFTYNPGYINFQTAFETLQKESTSWSEQGTASYLLKDGKLTITLDSTKDTFVTVPFSTIKSASSIEIAGLSSVQDFVNHKYVISCTGINSSNYTLSFYNIQFNGKSFNNILKDNLTGVEQGGQLNLNGMRLVWNFPDAAGNLTAQGLSGHLVAPQASISVLGGNFEGGVIAKSVVNADAEGHYYPYYAPGTTPEAAFIDPSPVDPTPVDPTPVDPTPVDPTPVDPTPVDPVPVDPITANPTPVDPAAETNAASTQADAQVLPQTGTFTDFYVLISLGTLFIFAGNICIFRKKL